MQEALYPVPQGPVSPAGPSRILKGQADPSPINPIPPSPLQGKPQDSLTVRLPFLFPLFPVLPNFYPPVIMRGKFQDPLIVSRLPALRQPPLPAGPALVSSIIVQGRPQDLLTVRSPFLQQPPLPGGYFNTKLLPLAGRVPPDLPMAPASVLFKFTAPIIPAPAGPTHHENVDLRRRYLLGIRRGGPPNADHRRRRR